ncbi:MAG: DNA mismatch repair protein MutS, partial [Tunicatimonas sp.]|uniref:MutS-related protein n=1 Tax=Tunicatimonas sp. TaxID=1940096 RepID=UPI003C7927B3
AYEAVAKTATNLNLQYPEYLNSSNPSIEVEGLFHPLLEHPVSNDFIIGTSGNLCFLTGANMSGKSTFLKSFAIAVYLSHLGLPVPAKKMTTTVSNGLFTTINLSDDLNQGYSHFYHEVKRVKEAAYRIKEEGKMIVIFDELFRGTNVKDASESSLSIISALANIPDSLFLISTHIIEIAEKLGDKKSVFFRSFNTKLENDEPVYDYRMIKGVSKESLGALIVRRERIIELLAQKKTNQP